MNLTIHIFSNKILLTIEKLLNLDLNQTHKSSNLKNLKISNNAKISNKLGILEILKNLNNFKNLKLRDLSIIRRLKVLKNPNISSNRIKYIQKKSNRIIRKLIMMHGKEFYSLNQK